MSLDPSTTTVRTIVYWSECTAQSRVPHDPIAGVMVEIDSPAATLGEAHHAACTHDFAMFAARVTAKGVARRFAS